MHKVGWKYWIEERKIFMKKLILAVVALASTSSFAVEMSPSAKSVVTQVKIVGATQVLTADILLFNWGMGPKRGFSSEETAALMHAGCSVSLGIYNPETNGYFRFNKQIAILRSDSCTLSAVKVNVDGNETDGLRATITKNFSTEIAPTTISLEKIFLNGNNEIELDYLDGVFQKSKPIARLSNLYPAMKINGFATLATDDANSFSGQSKFNLNGNRLLAAIVYLETTFYGRVAFPVIVYNGTKVTCFEEGKCGLEITESADGIKTANISAQKLESLTQQLGHNSAYFKKTILVIDEKLNIQTFRLNP